MQKGNDYSHVSMTYKMKKLPYTLIMTGLIVLLAAALAFIVIMILVSNTEILWEHGPFDIMTGVLVYGTAIITTFHLLIVLIALPKHIRHRKDAEGDDYSVALILISGVATVVSVILFGVALTHVIRYRPDVFNKLATIMVSCGMLLPFGIMLSGCIVNTVQKKSSRDNFVVTGTLF